MHSDHEVFERGVSQRRQVRLTFLSELLGRELVRQCAPLYHSRGLGDTHELECYYFWDFEARRGYNFTALSPSEITGMELMEDSFNLEDMRDPETSAGNPAKSTDGLDS